MGRSKDGSSDVVLAPPPGSARTVVPESATPATVAWSALLAGLPELDRPPYQPIGLVELELAPLDPPLAKPAPLVSVDAVA